MGVILRYSRVPEVLLAMPWSCVGAKPTSAQAVVPCTITAPNIRSYGAKVLKFFFCTCLCLCKR